MAGGIMGIASKLRDRQEGMVADGLGHATHTRSHGDAETPLDAASLVGAWTGTDDDPDESGG